jgi:hypothetical protein
VLILRTDPMPARGWGRLDRYPASAALNRKVLVGRFAEHTKSVIDLS